MAGHSLRVVSHEGAWRVSLGDALSRPYKSHKDAVKAALSRATEMSKEGLEAEVVMKVMTLKLGPDNYFKAVPTTRDTDRD